MSPRATTTASLGRLTRTVSERSQSSMTSETSKQRSPGPRPLRRRLPCPSFSIAGKRQGFEDPRGSPSLRYVESLRLSSQIMSSLKTLRGFCRLLSSTPMEKPCPRLAACFYRILESLGTWGILSNGRCFTADIGFPRTGSEFTLSEVLEASPSPKYFRSSTMQAKWKAIREGRREP